MIIDAHTHAWPDNVAARALGVGVSSMELFGDGTIAGLQASIATSGVDRSVVLAVANTPDRVESANRFVGALDRSQFIPFGTIHPGLSPEENVASLRTHDIHAAKLHPLFQSYALDDPALLAVLDEGQAVGALLTDAEAAGIPVRRVVVPPRRYGREQRAVRAALESEGLAVGPFA